MRLDCLLKDSTNTSKIQLGKSYTDALRTLQRMENSFKKDAELKLAYIEFMQQIRGFGSHEK